MGVLSVVPIYLGFRPDLLDPLTERLAETFRASVHLRTPWFDPEDAFDAARGQYHSTKLLERLLEEPSPQGSRILGVTGVDLFIPVLTYVFGEAQLSGRAAVVSVQRLKNEVYGLPPDPVRTLHRLEKEAIHELGHTYGLIHCRSAECVMHSSTYVEEIDLKGSRFCPECLAALQKD